MIHNIPLIFIRHFYYRMMTSARCNSRILLQNTAIATGAGHHSVIKVPDKDQWYIVYHRRPLTEKDGNSRVTCIEHMYFDEQGFIKPVVITKEGVEKNIL